MQGGGKQIQIGGKLGTGYVRGIGGTAGVVALIGMCCHLGRFGISDSVVRKYLNNRLAIDPNYKPPKRGIPKDLVLLLSNLGLRAATIAEHSGETPERITYIISKQQHKQENKV